MITLLPYKHTSPFPYTSQDNCLDISFAYAIQDEILHIPKEAWDRYNNPFEQKWTLRDKNQLPPNLHQLFQELTSPNFVDHLSTIVGTQLYNDPTKNWWGIHTYDDGDYLDIHCDAGIHPITRQKKHCTLGIYLSKDWREDNGGHLEIWEGSNINQDDRRLERCIEKILPTFNRLILFDNTNYAWHGNPEPVKCKNGEKRIFLTISYLSEIKDGGSREKAQFIKRPGDPEDPEKERLRELRVNPDRYKEIYNMMTSEQNKKENTKYLIYSSIFFNTNYIELFELLIKSYVIYNDLENTTYLIMCCDKLKLSIQNLFDKYKIKGLVWCLNLKTRCEACHSRYFIFDYPEIKIYNKILYLDCDILITNKLSNILDITLEDKIYALEEGNTNCTSNFWGKRYFKDSNPEIKAFNSGVLLFNNSDIIKTFYNNFIYHTNLDLTNNNYETLFQQTKDVNFDHMYGDQPLLVYLAVKKNLYNNLDLINKIKLYHGANLATPINYSGETIAHFCGYLSYDNGVDIKKNKMIQYLNHYKYIYLQPMGGFSDILYVVYNALNKYNRIVLLDTINSVYKINFSDYFDFKNKNIILDFNKIKCIYNNTYTIYPNSLNGQFCNILNGNIQFSRKIDNTGPWPITHITYKDISLYLPETDTSENIIINSQMNSYMHDSTHNSSIFKDLIIKPILKTYCHNNYQKLPGPYLSIHIRNTDYQCDYKNLYNENKEIIHQYKSIYIATDDKSSLEFFKERGLTIYNFTTFPDIISENLHYSEDISGDTKIKDLMSDLYIMTMSDKLLSNSKGGFIELIRHCIENKELIKDKFK